MVMHFVLILLKCCGSRNIFFFFGFISYGKTSLKFNESFRFFLAV